MIKSPISEFCEKRGLPQNIKDAFAAYARGVYADRFELRRDTDTVRLMVNNLTEDQMEAIWLEFISELKRTLVSEQSL